VFWRKLKLDWTYAIGELFIVIIGVLIALALDGWNNDRVERKQERDLVGRLTADIEGDLRLFDVQLRTMDRKEESLVRLRAAFASSAPVDAATFLSDVAVSANFGWSQMTANRVTFDDLLASGRLALIKDADVRARIASYYAANEGAAVRMDERETAYPGLTYQLVPRGPTLRMDNLVGDSSLQPGLQEDELDKLLEAVQRSTLEDHLIAEINLTRFIRAVTANLQTQGRELVARLEEYQQRIE
jgi:hypothetical protein